MAGKRISADKAVRLISNYRSLQYPKLHEGRQVGFQETKAVWFSFDELKTYINSLDTHRDVNNKSIDGIRIYFASYGNNPNDNDHGFTNRQTIVIVPTIPGDGSSKYNIDKHHDACLGASGKLERVNMEQSGTIKEADKLMYNEANGWPPPPPWSN